jgi:hypothetical protein
MSINKKAQEEMIGFAMIIVVVAVIFVVFLVIFLRGNSQERTDSKEVAMFLDSALELTTDCSPYSPNYYNVEQLIQKCASSSADVCPEGAAKNKKYCDVLQETLVEALKSGWNFGPNSPNKGATLDIKDASGNSVIGGPLIIFSCDSSATSKIRGADKPLSTISGQLTISLNVCLK